MFDHAWGENAWGEKRTTLTSCKESILAKHGERVDEQQEHVKKLSEGEA